MDCIGSECGFCYQTAGIWQFVGIVLNIIKILIPIIIIVLAFICLFKALVTKDEKEVKKSIKDLFLKLIVSIIIFFVPQIVSVCFGLVRGFSQVEDDYVVCKKCITNPKSTYCESRVIDSEID